MATVFAKKEGGGGGVGLSVRVLMKMTFTTLVHIFTSCVLLPKCVLSVIRGMKMKPHLSVAWNWFDFL